MWVSVTIVKMAWEGGVTMTKREVIPYRANSWYGTTPHKPLHIYHQALVTVATKGSKNSFFLRFWGLNLGPTPSATLPVHFCDGFSRDQCSWAVCPGWLLTMILLISASWLARITGLSHWHPAKNSLLIKSGILLGTSVWFCSQIVFIFLRQGLSM
jgi:hypothetical protein